MPAIDVTVSSADPTLWIGPVTARTPWNARNAPTTAWINPGGAAAITAASGNGAPRRRLGDAACGLTSGCEDATSACD